MIDQQLVDQLLVYQLLVDQQLLIDQLLDQLGAGFDQNQRLAGFPESSAGQF